MKKQTKLVMVVLALVMALTAVVALAACSNEETKVAYGLVHKEGYVGIATVVVNGDKLVEVSLDEACFPTQVKPTAADGDYTVAVTSGETTTYYWKTVKFADVTVVYDATNGYQVGSKSFKDYMKESEANCKAWAEAVKANNVTVVTSAGEKKDIMNAKTLLKSENGYWSGTGIREGQLGWKANKDATCKYIKENGFDAVTAKGDFSQPDKETGTGNLADQWVDKNNVKTGATWSDMWDYVNLLKTAYNK